MESNYHKGYVDQAIDLCNQIIAGTMSPEQAAAYWRELVVSTKDEWYASVRRQEHQDYIEERVPDYFRKPIDLAKLPNLDAYRQVMNWMAPEIEATAPIKNPKGLICIEKRYGQNPFCICQVN